MDAGSRLRDLGFGHVLDIAPMQQRLNAHCVFHAVVALLRYHSPRVAASLEARSGLHPLPQMLSEAWVRTSRQPTGLKATRPKASKRY